MSGTNCERMASGIQKVCPSFCTGTRLEADRPRQEAVGECRHSDSGTASSLLESKLATESATVASRLNLRVKLPWERLRLWDKLRPIREVCLTEMEDGREEVGGEVEAGFAGACPSGGKKSLLLTEVPEG